MGVPLIPTVTVERVTFATAEVRALIAALDAVLAAEYPPEQRHGLTLDALFKPHMRFYLARIDGHAVGCCGFATFDGFAELKRMFVADAARGRSVARALLAHVEREVEASGLAVFCLETGLRQVAALRLYESAGFQRCTAFGNYVAMPPDTLETSVFMEKHLRQTRM